MSGADPEDRGPSPPRAWLQALPERVRRWLQQVDRLRGFGARQILLRAAALTYLTIVSMVPLLAAGFFGLQALGLVDLGEKVRTFIFDNLAVGVREEIADHLARLVTNAGHGFTAGGIGLIALALSALLLLRNIEKAFDELWGLQRMRPLSKQLVLYVGVLLAGPIVLGLSLAITAALKGWALVYGMPFGQRIFSMVPFALSTAGFSLLYKVAPASKVSGRAAVLAGFLAASLWEGAKVGYAAYAVYTIRADSIYGPLAALPIFLVWIYLSWLIVLFGARIAFAIQHPERLRLAADPRAAAQAIEHCALHVALAACRQDPPSLHDLAQEIGFSEELVRGVIEDLEAAGLFVSGDGLRLARAPSTVLAGDVIRAVRGPLQGSPASASAPLRELLAAADDASLAALSIDLASLAGAMENRVPGTPAPLASG